MEIVIRPRTVERAVYIIIILALIGACYYLWQGTKAGCEALPAQDQGAAALQPPAAEPQAPAPATTAAPSCDDGLRNQDETDADCGGTVCGSCEDGKRCTANADCASLNCANKACAPKAAATAPASFSGRVTMNISDAKYTQTNVSNPKLTSLAVRIHNDKAEPQLLRLLVFVKTSDDMYYLNQRDEEERDYESPYAAFDLPSIPAGGWLNTSFPIEEARYLLTIGATQRYDRGDDFRVEAVLVDDNGDDMVIARRKVAVP